MTNRAIGILSVDRTVACWMALVLLLGASSLGCGSDDDPGEAGADTGDSGEQVDSETDTDTGPAEEVDTGGGGFTCAPKMHELARIDTPNPLISLGKTVTAGPEVTNPAKLVDGRYHFGDGALFGLPSAAEPAWAAIEIGNGPTRLLAIWADAGWNDYEDITGGAPLSYAIEVSADSTDGEDGAWEDVIAVADNPVRTRGHSFHFDGMTWVRLVVTAAQEGASAVEIDELAIYDLSASGDERPQDTWLFLGDSITKMAMERAANLRPFDTTLNDMMPEYHPAMISGGSGGKYSSFALENIELWLELNPDFTHIGLGYGTNDAWGDKSVSGSGYDDNLRALVEAILEAGRVPHLATIPYSTGDEHDTLPEFNAFLQELIVEYDLPCGPDFYTWYKENPDQISNDGVHPSSPTGLTSINRLWAEAASVLYVTE